jgi:hypothetical protein
MLTSDQIDTPALRRLFGYWEERRQGRRFPARRDIDPLDFSYVLGHVMLVDVLYQPLRFRFRLHGTELALRAGYDMTGKMADELPNDANRAVLIERCQTVIERQQPLAVIDERLLGKRLFGFEVLWMPLSDDDRTINMLLGGLFYRDSRAAIPESVPNSAA